MVSQKNTKRIQRPEDFAFALSNSICTRKPSSFSRKSFEKAKIENNRRDNMALSPWNRISSNFYRK